MKRELTPDQKAILDLLSRSTDPDQEALEQLKYLLETSPIVRQAFAAEMVRNRKFASICRAKKRDLPNKIAAALDELADRSPSFEILCARAERAGEPQPQREMDLCKD